MEKQRIQIYADAAIKGRIKAAAAKHNMAVTDYCLNAIQQQLAEDELLEHEQAKSIVGSTKNSSTALIHNLRALHQEILAFRSGQPIDVDLELEQIREERDVELTGLR